LDEILGNDAPEEFLCGLLYYLMREPVQLPNYGTICDFKNIKHHLLNDENDPFTRASLKIPEIIELPELKARIEKWIEQKRAGVLVTDEDLRKQAKTQEESKDIVMEDGTKP
jgi:ubiquitin conjugation factor E4 B